MPHPILLRRSILCCGTQRAERGRRGHGRGLGVWSGGRPEGRVTAGPGVLAGVAPCSSGRKWRGVGACRAALDTPERGSSRLHKTRGSGKPAARNCLRTFRGSVFRGLRFRRFKTLSPSFKASKQSARAADGHHVRCRQCNHPQRSQAPGDSWRDGLSQRQRDDVC